jgi:hypothetical protein
MITMFSFLRKTALWIVLAPCLTLGTGLTSNQLVLWANHDTFPVMLNTAKVNLYHMKLEQAAEAGDDEAQVGLALLEHGYLDDTHVIMTPSTHLNFLADVFDLRAATYSIGDFLLMLGEWSMSLSPFVWATVVIGRLRKREEHY